MTTYTTLTNAALAVGAVPSASKFQALRDNPIAIAEASNGAPVNVMGWHPVDKVTVGDGKQGVIYDFGTSGSVSSVVTPDFEDGYEYKIFGVDLSPSSSAGLKIDFYKETGANYDTAHTTGSTSGGRDFDCEITLPRVPKRNHVARFWTSTSTGISTTALIGFYDGTLQKILRARVSFSGANISGGKIWLFRRREFASAD